MPSNSYPYSVEAFGVTLSLNVEKLRVLGEYLLIAAIEYAILMGLLVSVGVSTDVIALCALLLFALALVASEVHWLATVLVEP